MNSIPGRVTGTGQQRPTEVRLAGWSLLPAVFAAGMVPIGMMLVIGGASLPVHRARAVS